MIQPTPYPLNIKKHPPEQLLKLAFSIREFGWRSPIVVDKENVILAGHGRWAAYEKYKEEYKLEEPWIVVADLTEEKAKAYRLADNLLASTDYDMDAVFQEVDQLALPFQDLLRSEPLDQTAKSDKQEEQFITDERYQQYLNNSIRQVVMHFTQVDFKDLEEKCNKLLKDMGLETKSDLFKKLVEDKYANNTSTTE